MSDIVLEGTVCEVSLGNEVATWDGSLPRLAKLLRA